MLYNRGMYAAMLAAEALPRRQEIHGTADITPRMMRDGMEALEITEAQMAELGLPNFGPAFKVSAKTTAVRAWAVQQWDAPLASGS